MSDIPRLYPGAHCIVAAPGPSLTADVVEKLRSVKDQYAIIGVGDAYRAIDFLDEHYACDDRWWKVHGPTINQTRPGLRSWCYDPGGTDYGAIKVQGEGKDGFSLTNDKIHFGSNSGYQTLNLCYLWGFSRMLLVGFNMQKLGGNSHFFTGRDPTLNNNSPYPNFSKRFNTIQPDIKKIIINCTPQSALVAFRKANLDDMI